VERVVARIFAIEQPIPSARPAIRLAAQQLGRDQAARDRPGDFAQALFDLGATVCTPAAPACGLCPWINSCVARRTGLASQLPRRSPKKPRPVRYGVHFWLTDDSGSVLLRHRPTEGLFGGMTELPGTAWRDTPWTVTEALNYAPMPVMWRPAGQVRHGLTHFELILDLLAAHVPVIAGDGFSHNLGALEETALPSVMRKCVRIAGAEKAG